MLSPSPDAPVRQWVLSLPIPLRLVLDGVHRRTDGEPVFVEADSPTDEDLHALLHKIITAVAETIKHRRNQGLPAEIHFWRDNHGTEIDLLFENAGRLHAVEIKSGATFSPDWLQACHRGQRYAGAAAAAPVLVYGGRDSYTVRRVQIMAWRQLGG